MKRISPFFLLLFPTMVFSQAKISYHHPNIKESSISLNVFDAQFWLRPPLVSVKNTFLTVGLSYANSEVDDQFGNIQVGFATLLPWNFSGAAAYHVPLADDGNGSARAALLAMQSTHLESFVDAVPLSVSLSKRFELPRNFALIASFGGTYLYAKKKSLLFSEGSDYLLRQRLSLSQKVGLLALEGTLNGMWYVGEKVAAFDDRYVGQMRFSVGAKLWKANVTGEIAFPIEDDLDRFMSRTFSVSLRFDDLH